MQVYPTRIEFIGLGSVPLPLKWPLKHFTVELDLERGRSALFGEAGQGYFRIPIELVREASCIRVGEYSLPMQSIPSALVPQERLSFGCHKASDWDKMRARADLREWLPHWHRVGQWVGGIRSSSNEACSYERLQELFEGNFSDYFVHDSTRWNLLGMDAKNSISGSPHIEGAALIRALLIQDEADSMKLLPSLPTDFVAGRYLNARCNWGTVDFEWTKGFMRRVVLRAEKSAVLTVVFPKGVKHCRVRGAPFQNSGKLELESGQTYYFDKFEG